MLDIRSLMPAFGLAFHIVQLTSVQTGLLKWQRLRQKYLQPCLQCAA